MRLRLFFPNLVVYPQLTREGSTRQGELASVLALAYNRLRFGSLESIRKDVRSTEGCLNSCFRWCDALLYDRAHLAADM